MFKGAIFDMDGTLIDSMPIWNNLGAQYLKSKGFVPREDIGEVLKPLSLQQAAQYFINEYGIKTDVEGIINEINSMIDKQYRELVPLKPHVESFLEKLHIRGINMCIATATDLDLAGSALIRLGINRYFNRIITPAQAGMGKDNPEFYTKARELIGTSISDTIVFEDSLHAIKSAKKAGFFVVGVFDESSLDDLNEIQKISDRFIYSFNQWEMDE